MSRPIPEGFRPCYTCRLTYSPPDLCDMCEEILERWEEDEKEVCGNCDGEGVIAAQPEEDDPFPSWQDARGEWFHACQDCRPGEIEPRDSDKREVA